MATVAALARRLDAVRGRCPCPLGCGYALHLAEGEDGKHLFYCFGGCDYEAIRTALVPFGLLDDDDGEHDDRIFRRHDRGNDKRHVEIARDIYERLPPVAEIAKTYLRSRAITIFPSVLRSGLCPHRVFKMHPAVAAPVVDINGVMTGVHMTFLRTDGSGKADFADPAHQRECRGVVRNGVVRLGQHNQGRALILGEGLETTLSAMQIFGLPGWSAVSAGGLKALELPPSVRTIIIAADNDRSGAGQRAAKTAYERWTGEEVVPYKLKCRRPPVTISTTC